MRHRMMALVAAPLAMGLLVAEAGAQTRTRRPARRQAPIEIRGQVPTPQVVTVRPREVPQYNRRFLVPNFYDHDFWPAILPGYQLVSRRLINGNGRLDSLTAGGADAARMADSASMAMRARAAIGIGLLAPRPGSGFMPGDSTRRMMMPADTTRRALPATPPAVTPPAGTPPTTRGTRHTDDARLLRLTLALSTGDARRCPGFLSGTVTAAPSCTGSSSRGSSGWPCSSSACTSSSSSRR